MGCADPTQQRLIIYYARLVLQSRLAFVWAGRFGAPPAEGRCGAGAGVQAIFADSVDWLARAQGQLFLDAVESRALPRSLPYSALSLVATLWAVRGPMFDLGAALESANLGSAAGATAAIVTQVADDLSLARLIREVPNVRSRPLCSREHHSASTAPQCPRG